MTVEKYRWNPIKKTLIPEDRFKRTSQPLPNAHSHYLLVLESYEIGFLTSLRNVKDYTSRGRRDANPGLSFCSLVLLTLRWHSGHSAKHGFNVTFKPRSSGMFYWNKGGVMEVYTQVKIAVTYSFIIIYFNDQSNSHKW